MATTLFSDLATRVLQQCGNRSGSQDVTQSQNAVADAIKDICSASSDDYYIDELEVVGPNFNLVANVDTYAVTSAAGTTGGYTNGAWLNTGDTLQSIMDVIVYTDAAPTANSATTPAPWLQIYFQSYKRQNRIAPFSGSYPVLATRRGSVITGSGATAVATNLLFFRAVPNATWTTFMVYRKMHPFTSTYPYSTTGLILPTEWEKCIVDLATALMWAGWLKEPERAAAMRQQVGLMEDGTVKGGLMQRLMSKRKREAQDGAQDTFVEFIAR